MLTLDCRAFGGQAAPPARIENYLGFPTGISGMALMGRAFNQAQKFGVDMAIPDEAVTLECGDPALCAGWPPASGCGPRHRHRDRRPLPAAGCRPARPNSRACSIHYWASPIEAALCANEEVALVGGGNSAGQAMCLSRQAGEKVWLLIPAGRSRTTMSHYLVDRIEQLANVQVVVGGEVAALRGERRRLDADRPEGTGSPARRDAVPRPSILLHRRRPQHRLAGPVGLRRDRAGFVLTGARRARAASAGDEPRRSCSRSATCAPAR